MAGRRHPDAPLETDGPLPPNTAAPTWWTRCSEVWGQGFAAPTFSEEVEVLSQRLVGEKHLALKLRTRASPWTASGSATPSRCPRALLAFRLE
jgi:single-stranded-DNA-specific exonuclease